MDVGIYKAVLPCPDVGLERYERRIFRDSTSQRLLHRDTVLFTFSSEIMRAAKNVEIVDQDTILCTQALSLPISSCNAAICRQCRKTLD